MGQLVQFPNHKVRSRIIDHGYNGSNVLSFAEAKLERDLGRSISRHPAGKQIAPAVEEAPQYKPRHLAVSKIVPDCADADEIISTVYNVYRLDAMLESLTDKLTAHEMAQLVDQIEVALLATATNMYSVGASDGFEEFITEHEE